MENKSVNEEVKLQASAGVVGEFAFVTKKMSEKAFEEKAARVTVLNRIRTEWEA